MTPIDALEGRNGEPLFDSRLMLGLDLDKFDFHALPSYIPGHAADGCEIRTCIRDSDSDCRPRRKRHPGLDKAAGQTQITSDDNHVLS